MESIGKHRRAWLLIGLCLALLFPLSPGVVEAKKAGNKCEGTKKQRKQKMELRDITDEHLAEMLTQYKQTVADDREQMKETIVRRLEREYEEHQATGEPFVFDVLVISGGGAKGAFGAGFLEGWGTVPPGPVARPEFDVVTGVSTGALIAPFAFVGTDEAYASVVDFYANPGENWVKKRGALYLMPNHVSLFNNCHLQDMIRESVDESIVQNLADVAAEDRLLAIGTTNLDAGSGRVFNLGLEAQNALQSGTYDRVHSILLASSAIPGAFPPVEMDDMLYGDGGATSNLILMAFPRKDGPVARFRENNPGAPLPKVRIWVLVNQQLLPKPAVTQPRWVSVSGRALDTLTSTGQLFAMDLIKTMVRDANEGRGFEAELRYVAIPADAPKKTTKEMFDKEYMLKLEDLGRLMGADPSNWSDEIPSPYGLEDSWLDSD
jgi:predicted acylesterase/phospholipase RssA